MGPFAQVGYDGLVAAVPSFVVPEAITQDDETLGTKQKFWFTDEAGRRRLFKRSPQAGEDWSEWAAAKLSDLLGTPAAEVHLAEHRGQLGVISTSFLEPGDQMFHGNELLAGQDPDYPEWGSRKVRAYTVQACLDAMEGAQVTQTPGCRVGSDGMDQFIGYLLLDAWLSNADRHHENWAVLRRGTRTELAPSYDHAASLGRNLPVGKVMKRPAGTDPRVSVSSFCARARSAFQEPGATDIKTLHPRTAFLEGARFRGKAAQSWLDCLEEIGSDEIEAIFASIPARRISDAHRAFAVKMLACNRAALLALREKLG